MPKIDFSVDDLTKSALKRLVQQLLAAPEGKEEEILKQIGRQDKERNDLTALQEEKRGKAPKVEVEEDEQVEEAD